MEYLPERYDIHNYLYFSPSKTHTTQTDVTAADYPDPHPAGPLDDNSESSSGFGSLTRKEKTATTGRSMIRQFDMQRETSHHR